MPKATKENTTNRRAFLSTMAAGVAAGASTLALAAVPALALPADPIYGAIETHRVAATDYEEAEREYSEALSRARQRADEIVGEMVTHWWHFAPNDLGYHAACGLGRRVDVSDEAVPPGHTKCYSGIQTHAHIDAIADTGVMYRGERERLHAALDGNLRHKDAIDRLGVAADQALEVERRAMRELIDTKATTMAGALALTDYLGAPVG